MHDKKMPGKLVAVIGLLVSGIAVNLVSASFISAIIQSELLLGVLAGNDGVRTFLRGLAAVNILIVAVYAVGGATVTTGDRTLLVAAAVLSIVLNAYLIWALGQADVRDWMFRKNFKLDTDA